MSFSTAIRKARDLGRRSLAIARGPAGAVEPRATYGERPVDRVVVLQRGDNPSTDYYLRPRLPAGVPITWGDVREPPDVRAAFGGCEAALVIVCRYASTAWLDLLERERARITRLAFFADDDLPAMMTDRSLPLAVRGKVAEGYARHVERLSGLCGEVWVSTEALAQAYPASRAAVLHPLPEADAPEPHLSLSGRIVYHGTDVHAAERDFALSVAQTLRELGRSARFEITGDQAMARTNREPGVQIVPQLPWPQYLDRVRVERADLFLAPLGPSRVNAARAPVKAFDAARLGAVGLYADREPYRGFVRNGETGLLLPDDPQAWAEAAGALLDDPDRRLRIAKAAREQLVALRRRPDPLPDRPAA